MTILLPVHKIPPPEWMRDPDLIRLLDILNHDDINARMVGGCIRNHFFNKSVYDIDIACKFNPEKTSHLLKDNGIRVIPTGIEHGTITAHINGKNFEITSLRQDIDTDGRHAKVAFSESWIDDARRRDFTMNALYADRDGSIYDPLGSGFLDLKDHIVRFIGNAEQRIIEDALRILRFYRFCADYNDGITDVDSITACETLKDKIHNLSDERIYDEVFKILKSDNAYRALELMHSSEIFNIPDDVPEQIKSLIDLQSQLSKIDIVTRYYLSKISIKYIKNNKQKTFIDKLDLFINSWSGDIKHALYHFNRDVVIQGLLVLKVTGSAINDMILTDAINLKIPILPIIAADVMRHFKIPEGRQVGEKLKAGERAWIESDFKLLRDEILEKI